MLLGSLLALLHFVSLRRVQLSVEKLDEIEEQIIRLLHSHLQLSLVPPCPGGRNASDLRKRRRVSWADRRNEGCTECHHSTPVPAVPAVSMSVALWLSFARTVLRCSVSRLHPSAEHGGASSSLSVLCAVVTVESLIASSGQVLCDGHERE